MALKSYDEIFLTANMEPIIRTGEPMVRTELEVRYNQRLDNPDDNLHWFENK